MIIWTFLGHRNLTLMLTQIGLSATPCQVGVFSGWWWCLFMSVKEHQSQTSRTALPPGADVTLVCDWSTVCFQSVGEIHSSPCMLSLPLQTTKAATKRGIPSCQFSWIVLEEATKSWWGSQRMKFPSGDFVIVHWPVTNHYINITKHWWKVSLTYPWINSFCWQFPKFSALSLLALHSQVS